MQRAKKSSGSVGSSDTGSSSASSTLDGENLQLVEAGPVEDGTPTLLALGLGASSEGGSDAMPETEAEFYERLRTSDNPARTYRQLALGAHPDKGGSREAWDALQAAYDRFEHGHEEGPEAGDETAIEGPLPIESGAPELPSSEPLAIEAPEPMLMIEAPPERSVMDEYVGARDDYQSNMSQVMRDYAAKERARKEAEALQREAEEAEREAEREREREREEQARREEEEAARLNEEAASELTESLKRLVPDYKRLTVKPDGLDGELTDLQAALIAAKKAGTAATQKAALLERIGRVSTQIADQLALATEEAETAEALGSARDRLKQAVEPFRGTLNTAKGLTAVELSWDADRATALEGPRDRLQAVRDEVHRRRKALQVHADALEASPQVDGTLAASAREAIAGDGDLSTLGTIEDDLALLKEATGSFTRKALDAKKAELTAEFAAGDAKLSPKRQNKLDAWVKSGVPKTRVSKTDFEALITVELEAQYKVNKSQWLDLLGLSPWGKLWGQDSVGIVSGYNVHASLFKDAMAGIVKVDTTSGADAKDALLSSGTGGFHVTMEVYGKYGNGGHNPHSYRGGPTRKKNYSKSDWGTTARAEFEGIRDVQVAEKEALIQTTIDEKASNLEPG